MERDPELNIFDAAAQQNKKKKAETPTRPADPPAKAAMPEEQTSTQLSNMDIQDMLKHMQSIQKEIENKANIVYDKIRVNPKELQKFLAIMGGPQWEKAQKDRKNLEEKVWSALGIEETEGKKAKVRKEEDKATKARKGKTVGVRKNWIPMR